MIPTSGDNICHDIPFGYTKAKPDRPLFAINWLHSGGLVYVNGGNVKHSVQDGVIMNVVAWGGNRFDNRMHMGWLNACEKYDIRLYGTHKITYYIIPVSGFDGSAVSKRVAGITTPVYIVDGRCDESLFKLERDDIAVTSIYSKDGGVYYRGVKLPSSEKADGDFSDFTSKRKN